MLPASCFWQVAFGKLLSANCLRQVGFGTKVLEKILLEILWSWLKIPDNFAWKCAQIESQNASKSAPNLYLKCNNAVGLFMLTLLIRLFAGTHISILIRYSDTKCSLRECSSSATAMREPSTAILWVGIILIWTLFTTPVGGVVSYFQTVGAMLSHNNFPPRFNGWNSAKFNGRNSAEI